MLAVGDGARAAAWERVSQTIFRRTVLSMSRHARSSVSSDSIGVWLQMCACG